MCIKLDIYLVIARKTQMKVKELCFGFFQQITVTVGSSIVSSARTIK